MSASRERTRYPGIYKRGGRYVYIYRDPQGRQRSSSAATLGEAKARRSDALAKVAHGRYREPSTVTFADYAPEWLRSYAGRTSRGLRAATREDYGRVLGVNPGTGEPFDPPRDAIAFFGRARLSEIRPRDIKDGGILHHEADDVRILVEIFLSGGYCHGLVTIVLLLVQPHAGTQYLVHEVLHQRRLLLG